MVDWAKRFRIKGLTYDSAHRLNVAAARSADDTSEARKDLGREVSLFLDHNGKDNPPHTDARYNFITVIGVQAESKLPNGKPMYHTRARVTAFQVNQNDLLAVEKIREKHAPRGLWRAIKDWSNPACEAVMPVQLQSTKSIQRDAALKTLEIERYLSEKATIVCSILVDEFEPSFEEKLGSKSVPVFDLNQEFQRGENPRYVPRKPHAYA